jgi:hypothetical protein
VNKQTILAVLKIFPGCQVFCSGFVGLCGKRKAEKKSQQKKQAHIRLVWDSIYQEITILPQRHKDAKKRKDFLNHDQIEDRLTYAKASVSERGAWSKTRKFKRLLIRRAF